MMTISMTHLRLGSDSELDCASIGDAVTALLDSGVAEPRLDVTLTGDTLPAQVISALISGLRKLREQGGGIVVEAEREGARQALQLTGLDRVFAPPLMDDGAEQPRGDAPRVDRRRPNRFAASARAALVAGLAAVVAFSNIVPAQAQPELPTTDPAAIVARVLERNPSLTSYQSRLHVDLRLTTFPFFRQHLDGATYFKRPNNYEVDFDHVPSYAAGFEKLYSDVGDPSAWEKRFVMSYVGTQEFENRKDIELRLVQRVRGQIDHEIVLVDPNAWTIDKLEYHYYNGGTIAMTQHFSPIAGYHVIVSQDASIDIPHVRAVAHGTYDEYKTNVAVDDAVFTKNK